MGNGCWSVSSSIISHWAYGVIATLNQRHWRWFNVAQRRVSMGMFPRDIFRGANSTKVFTGPERNATSSYHLLLCICKENPLALTIFHQPRVTWLVRICIPDCRSLPIGIWSVKGKLSEKFAQVCVWSHFWIRRGIELLIFYWSILFSNQITDTSRV